MHLQVDEHGCNAQILDSIVDCRKDSNAVDNSETYLCTKSGPQRLSHTTSGWSLLMPWKNEEEEWMLLNRLNHHLPLETSEFAVGRRIDDGLAFKW